MKLIIDIPEEVYKPICDKYGTFPREMKEWGLEAIKNGIPIPDNATNGNVVKTLFSNTFDNFCERTTWEWNRWWNAPYQKGGKE